MTEERPVLTIDADVQACIPPLTAEEYAQLETNIRAEGCRDALVLWDETSILLDGHNRYAICQAHGVAFTTTRLSLPDRAAALVWVLRNQLGRRNLCDLDRVALALRLKPMLAEEAKARQGTRTDLVENFPQGSKTREDLAALAGVSDRTVDKVETILAKGDPTLHQAIREHGLSISAAMPLMDLPKEAQPQALAEATQEAIGTKPTAVTTRAVVNRAQVVATTKAQLAAGKSPREAVDHALAVHAVILPTPALATALAEATHRQVLIAATDGILHDGRTKAEEAAIMAQTKRLFQLYNALEGLATLTNLASLVEEIPHYSAHRVEQYLDQALDTLQAFTALWKEAQHDSPASAGRSV